MSMIRMRSLAARFGVPFGRDQKGVCLSFSFGRFAINALTGSGGTAGVGLFLRTHSSSSASLSSSSSASLEVVQTLRLNDLRDIPGAVHAKRRVGRGVGSSKGKTCGRGHKGQKAKESIHPLFEGGQTKLYKLLPKRGFNNKPHAQELYPLNLSTLQQYIDMGRVDPTKPIALHDLLSAGIFKANAVKHGVKLLGTNDFPALKQAIRIQVNRASDSAIARVEELGGQVKTVHHNRLALRQELRPHKFADRPAVRQARPPPKWQPYYTSYKHRGYLNPVVQMQEWLERHPQHQSSFEKATEKLLSS